MNTKKILSSVSLAACVLLATTTFVRASLIAYEGFDYTPGETIGGKNGGIGWKAPWLTGTGWDLATNVAGSLSYVDSYGNQLLTSGNSLLVGSYSSTASKPARTFANFNADGTNFLSGGTYWISFLAQRVGPRYDTPPVWGRQANFGLFANAANSDGQERFDVGRPNTNSFTGTPYDTWAIWHANGLANNGAQYAKPSTNYPLENVTFVLIRLDTDNDPTTGDRAYVWFNWPDLLTEPSTASAVLTDIGEVDLTSINQIRIHCNGYSGANTNAWLWVDEIRVGTTFADVTPLVPEPSAMVLAIVGGLGLLVLRLRNKH